MKAFTILRVSSKEQKKGYGFESQWEDDILPGAEEFDLEVSETLCRKIDESASKGTRSDFATAVREAIALHRKGEIEALLFPRVDRESRDGFKSVPLLNECFENGLPVYFAHEELYLDPKDLETKKKYLEEVNRAMDYVITLKRNTTRGRKKRARHGLIPSKGHLYGYQYIHGKEEGQGIRQIDKSTAMWVETIFKRYNDGLSLNEIAHKLTEAKAMSPSGNTFWYKNTVRDIIMNPAYTGKTVFDGVDLPGVTPAIISQELFGAAQARLKLNKHLYSSHSKYEYLIGGYVFCGECGHRMSGFTRIRNGKERKYYRCFRTHQTSPKPCTWAAQVNGDQLEAQVWQRIEEALTRPENILEALNKRAGNSGLAQLEAWLIALNNNIKQLEAKKRWIYQAYYDHHDQEMFDQNLANNEALIKQSGLDKIALEEQIEQIRRSDYDLETINELRDILINSLSVSCEESKTLSQLSQSVYWDLNLLTFKQKRALFNQLQLKVIVGKEKRRVEGIISLPVGVAELAIS